jgi:hypothetical protein
MMVPTLPTVPFVRTQGQLDFAFADWRARASKVLAQAGVIAEQ